MPRAPPSLDGGARGHAVRSGRRFELDHFLRAIAVLAGLDRELDAAAFVETAEAVALDVAVVDEHILLAAFNFDEAVALFVTEPLHASDRHAHLQTLG